MKIIIAPDSFKDSLSATRLGVAKPDARIFHARDGLSWTDSSNRTFVKSMAELKEWVGDRAQAGRRVAVDEDARADAVRALEGKELVKHVGPKIFVVDPSNIDTVPQTNILPPDGYKPVFSVN